MCFILPVTAIMVMALKGCNKINNMVYDLNKELC